MEPTAPRGSSLVRDFVQGQTPAPEPLPTDFEAALAQRRAVRDQQSSTPKSIAPRPLANRAGFKQVYGAADAIARIPAPGGIAALLVILLVLLIFLVPVTSDRETRANLFFDVLGGSKRVKGHAFNPVPAGGPMIPGLGQNPYTSQAGEKGGLTGVATPNPASNPVPAGGPMIPGLGQNPYTSLLPPSLSPSLLGGVA